MATLLQLFDDDGLALIVVAVITGGSGIVVAVVTGVFSILQNRRTRTSLEARIGTPNGQGNVVQMQEISIERIARLEQITIAGQSEQDKRIARLEQADVDHDRTLDRHDRQLREHSGRLAVLEATTTPQEGS